MRLKFLLLVLILLSLLAACKGGKAAPTPSATSEQGFTPAGLDWLKAHAVPFKTSDPAAPLDDLASLKSMVGDARVVALGDATYGTHEFFQMKHRILEYLVEAMGFNALVMPVDFLQADQIDAYIHTGEGKAAELLKGYEVFDTQEILDTIDWMRTYNADPAHPRKVSFYGFGMPPDQRAIAAVTEFIQKVDASKAVQIQDDYSCYQASDECKKKLQDAYDLLNAHRAGYISASSPAEFEKALHGARVVIQNTIFSANSINYDLYTQYMAENMEWAVDQAGPDGKVVLWAHNGTVWTTSSKESSPSEGDYLHQKYQKQMITFGFLFYHGSFNAMRYANPSSMQVFHVPEPSGESYEFFFQATGLPHFFLDMRSAQPGSPDQSWLFAPHSSYVVGGIYDLNNPSYFTDPLAKMYDVVIYFKDTTPSILLNQ